MSEASPLAWYCFNVFCWPLKLCMNHKMDQPSRGAHVRQAHVPRKAPPPLPARERRLSITKNEPDATTPVTTSNQPQSRFFSLLPKEIRLQIYEHVLGGRLLHLGFEDDDLMRAPYLRRYPCLSGDDASTWDHTSCWGRRNTPSEKLLPLLQSCRLVCVPFPLSRTNSPLVAFLTTQEKPHSYTEAIPLLYTANTFSFKDSDCLKYLPTLIPPQRFDAIRSLKLHWHLRGYPSEDPTAKENYDEIWRIIASMPRLRELRVQLAMHSRPHISFWRANEAVWLAPLKDFKELEVFELDMPQSTLAQPRATMELPSVSFLLQRHLCTA